MPIDACAPRVSGARDDATPPATPQKPPSEVARVRALPVTELDLDAELAALGARAHRFQTDPLADDVYAGAHAAAERLETRGKNIERDLLAHNSHKIRGDLEKLHSPDWIRAIGLSTALQAHVPRKELELRKAPLVAHLQSTLEKYNAWSKDLKRKKNGRAGTDELKESMKRGTSHGTDDRSDGGEIDDSDVETRRRRMSSKRSRLSSTAASASKPPAKKPPKPEAEFTSFYDKPYMREQALSKWRKSSRTQTAFGQPLPVITEKEFALPEELVASAAAARHARARKRLSR